MSEPERPAPDDQPAPEPEEREVVRLARWLESWPSNQDGEDKTWVLRWQRSLERTFRNARKLPGVGP